jgi:hypothetical protein
MVLGQVVPPEATVPPEGALEALSNGYESTRKARRLEICRRASRFYQ